MNNAAMTSPTVAPMIDGLPSYSRYVVAGLGNLSLVFPDVFVAEIMIIERSDLLQMPFFDPSVLGVIHHQGLIVPLISLKRALLGVKTLVTEKVTVVRLSEELEELAGAGLVVDRVISSISSSQYEQQYLGAGEFESMRLESLLGHLGERLWQPYRWHPVNMAGT